MRVKQFYEHGTGIDPRGYPALAFQSYIRLEHADVLLDDVKS